MTFLDHVRLMAAYNAWMNERLINAVAGLSPAALSENRGAFFGSVLGTLNHLLVTDLMWIGRFEAVRAARPALDGPLAMARPTRLDETIHHGLAPLAEDRRVVDAALVAFAAALDESDLTQRLAYRRANGEAQAKALGSVLSHLFNHQTHHRGQITTLLSQAGIDVGVTDVNALIPNLA